MFRHLPVAVLAATLTAGALAAPAAAEPDRWSSTRTQSAARMECPGETPYCTKNSWAKKKVRQFKRGALGRFRNGLNIHYPAALKRKITNGVIRKSKRITRHERKKAWRAYADNDNCIVTGEYGYLHECRKGRSKLRKLGNSGVVIVKCSGTTYIAMFAGAIGGPPGIAAGGIGGAATCAWEEVWDRRR